MRNTTTRLTERPVDASLEYRGGTREKAAVPPTRPRYFERPDPGEQPLSLLETFMIVLSAHLGVRTREKRQEDFRRANGLHLFIAGITYFSLLIVGLIILVGYVTR